ncbi:MAG: hypothetical protein ACP5HG_10335 [Anaerolineae bacterium]
MPLRKALRESAFRLARKDVASFLEDHEDRLLALFREEMQTLDDQLPEEQVFIDIRMVPLGEAILKSALHAITRFLNEDYSSEGGKKVEIPVKDEGEGHSLTLKESSS